MKELKYQEEINKLESDFSNFKEKNRESYIAVFEDLNDPRNFLPKYQRRSGIQRDTYIGWALSLFDSETAIKNKFTEMKGHSKNIHKLLGDYIAEGTLVKDDGISNDSNSYGHFSHFEYKDVKLNTRFKLKEKFS